MQDVTAKNENELQMNGILFCKYKHFVQSHFYNENITTYGWDDSDIKKTFFFGADGKYPVQKFSLFGTFRFNWN